jgi:transposase
VAIIHTLEKGGQPVKVFAGIDVGAKTVVLAWRRGGRTVGQETIPQSVEGHRQMVARLRALKPAHVVLEATGIYYLDLAVTLAQADLPVSVINPKSFHHFARLKLQGNKTDGIDAQLLAEYGERMTPPPWVVPDPTRLSLRDLGRQINRLTATRTQAKNRLHALRAKRGTLALLIEDEVEAIATLDRRIERLTLAARELLKRHPALAEQVALLDSATGIAEASAIALLAELCVLPTSLTAAQVARFAGLDVRLCQSGTSVNKAARISKAGNAYLRAGLYMPALSAVRYDPRARAFYEALQRRGKKKMQALCAVMRKMLTGLWACLKTGQPFDSTKLFSEIHLVKT